MCVNLKWLQWAVPIGLSNSIICHNHAQLDHHYPRMYQFSVKISEFIWITEARLWTLSTMTSRNKMAALFGVVLYWR